MSFLKKEEEKEEEREGGRRTRRKRGTSLLLEIDPSHFGPCDVRLQSTLATNTLLDKFILFRLLINTLYQKAPKVCIDLIINWY